MMLSKVKYWQIKRLPDTHSAAELADRMLTAGVHAASVDVTHLPGRSLAFLTAFPFLRYLSVSGPARSLESIACLRDLRELCFLSVKVQSFDFLAELQCLRLFDMRFGGCKSFHTLAAAGHLVGLSFLHMTSLRDLSFVSPFRDLEYLSIHECKQIASLPDLAPCTALRKLVLLTMNGLTSLRGIESAPALEQLVVGEARDLPPTEFARVTRCAAIQKVLVGLAPIGSARHTEALQFVPNHLRMAGYYGTEFENFSFRSYPQHA